MADFTFDDGAPLDAAQLQKLYAKILDVEGKLPAPASSTLGDQTVVYTPYTWAGSTDKSSTKVVMPAVGKLAHKTINYAGAGFDASAVPRISVTPKYASALGVGGVNFFVDGVTYNQANIYFSTTSKSMVGKEINFDYVVVWMKQK